MNVIDSVSIEGLWGQFTPTIDIIMNPHFNFIIGQNGTGKTTVVNLIAAVLRADFDTLDKIQFSKITIKLKDLRSRKRPSIVVSKEPKKNLPYYDIEYTIRESAKGEALTFDLDALAEERYYRGIPPRLLREKAFRQKYLDIQKQLQTFVNVCWLSVHRYTEEERARPEKVYASAVDQKLADLNNELVKYFSQLSRKYADQTKEFQKRSFLSMLTSEKETDVIGFSNRIDIDTEKTLLANVFRILDVSPDEFEKKLKTHFSKFSDARTRYSAEQRITTIQFAAIYNAWKTHSLVQHYSELEAQRQSIFKPRVDFLSVINELFGGRKIADISMRNELVVETKDGRQIPLEELSSGEKQLLIILGEALLQESSRVVYIADEPELSLHVRWQEQLTNAISRLNPHAQIVFATHSPDIVNIHTNNIIDMEKILG